MNANELKRRFSHASKSFLKLNSDRADGISSNDEKQPQGNPLVDPIQREAKGSVRFKIVFEVYATRPADWDAYDVKELQDLVVKSGIIPDDDWSTLTGEIVPKKVGKKTEEKTVIIIEQL